MLGLEPVLRNRLNAIYMASYFLGGALGTVMAAIVWGRMGWIGVCALGAGFSLAGVLPLLRARD